MRILIVEDEFNAREGLARLIEKISPEHEICGKATNGQDGLEMTIAQKPDLVFVDIEMPKFSGLEMIERIRNIRQADFQAPSFVILSGYAEFKYAQQAIKSGVQEYLLKPISYEKLQAVIKNLGKIVEMKKLNGVSRMVDHDAILSSILLESEAYCKEAIELIKGSVSPGNLFLMNIYFGQNKRSENLIEVVQSFCEYFSFENAYISTIKKYDFLSVLINTDKDISEVIKYINFNLLFSIKKIGFRDTTVTLFPIEAVDELTEMLDKVIAQNAWALTLGNERVIYPGLTSSVRIENHYQLRKFDIEALCAIKNSNTEDLKRINEELLACLKEKNYYPEQIIKSCISYAFSILVCYKELDLEVYEKAQSLQLLDKLKSCCTLGEIRSCLNELADLYKQSEAESHKEYSMLVRKIICYIGSSYVEKVSLEAIAGKMNVSPEYLSHLFTKEVGISFSDYLKKYRIDIAKKLMLHAGYKIYEIGEQIGYRDPKYFSKVFKEVTGLSPKEYAAMQ